MRLDQLLDGDRIPVWAEHPGLFDALLAWVADVACRAYGVPPHGGSDVAAVVCESLEAGREFPGSTVRYALLAFIPRKVSNWRRDEVRHRRRVERAGDAEPPRQAYGTAGELTDPQQRGLHDRALVSLPERLQVVWLVHLAHRGPPPDYDTIQRLLECPTLPAARKRVSEARKALLAALHRLLEAR